MWLYTGSALLRTLMMKTINILVVDDDAVVTSLLCHLFEHEGYKARAVHSAEDALDELRKMKFSLLLTDYSMSGMNGVDLARAARSLNPDIFIILCTAHLTAETKRAAEEAGIDRIILKPFLFPEVIEVARAQLDSQDASN